jgi:phosphopantothenoylcysteine decarboxylase/phosphopantothenate--cysteine ligase
MPEVPEILAAIKRTLGKNGPLAGKKVVVTAGGTQEPLDPVRFIGNGSSGRMGYAIAEEALNAGAQVTLITGAASAQPPYGVALVHTRTTREMEAAVQEAVQDADVLIMAAAVADFVPKHTSEQKIKKTDAGLTVELERNPDILAGLAAMDLPRLVRVGFAAETENLLENARAKLAKKKLDLIVANDAVASIGTESSSITFVRKDGNAQHLPYMPKEASAHAIVEEVARLVQERS